MRLWHVGTFNRGIFPFLLGTILVTSVQAIARLLSSFAQTDSNLDCVICVAVWRVLQLTSFFMDFFEIG